MQPLSAQLIFVTASDLQKVRNIIHTATTTEAGAANFPLTALLVESDRKEVFLLLAALRQELVKLETRASIASVDKVFTQMNNNTLTYGLLGSLIDEIDGRVRDEIGASFVFILTAQEANLYNAQAPLLSDLVSQKFPSAAFDVDETAKCLALGRSTAAVYHAMRVTEYGLKSIALCLGIPDPTKPEEKNWGNILKAINEQINRKWPTVSDRDYGDGDYFESVYALLQSVRSAWRNKTMHPRAKYTEQEANSIIQAVAGFMVKLAERCDEQGEPKVQ